MTAERLAELLTACPELTIEDIERLKTYRPKRSLLSAYCRMAFLEMSAS